MRFLLRNNMIPDASIIYDDKINLKSSFLGFDLKYPIGLAPGIDLIGKGMLNLNKLGFEYIEVGPLLDYSENENKANIYLSKDTKGKNIVHENQENHFSVYFSLPHLQGALLDLDRESKNVILSTNLKISNKSLNTVPYMSDTLFTKSLQSIFHISDVITINMSSYKSKAILQYKNMNKLEKFMDKLKETIYYEMGVKAILNYETLVPPKEGENKIFDLLNLQFQNTLLKYSRPKILLRLDTKLTNEDIKNYVELSKKSGIIDGFVVGGMTTKGGSDNYVAGESNREESTRVLKEFYNYTKGEFALISTGGVLTGEDVYERLKNGADLILIYSPFILNGPYCMEKLIKELEEKMKKEGKFDINSIKS